MVLGANGKPLKTRGQIQLPIRLESLHTFIVSDKLTVDCILGADFLYKDGAVLNCHCSCVPHTLPPTLPDKIFTVIVSEDIVVQSCHVVHISGVLQHHNKNVSLPVGEGLVEPIESTACSMCLYSR